MRDTIGTELCYQGKPIPMGAPVSLGCFRLTVDATNANNDLATLLAAATPAGVLATLITAGLSIAKVSVSAFPIRMRCDAGDATAGGTLWPISASEPYTWDPSDFTKIQMVGVGGSATVDIEFFA